MLSKREWGWSLAGGCAVLGVTAPESLLIKIGPWVGNVPEVRGALFVVAGLVAAFCALSWFLEWLEYQKFLVVKEGDRKRYFGWNGMGPVHLIADEQEPVQLGKFFIPLGDECRKHGMEPMFWHDLAGVQRGHTVYEISKDKKTKWKLLGGNNGVIDAASNQTYTVISQAMLKVRQ